MYKELLKAKIHRAVMAENDLYYEGSITTESNLLDLSGIQVYEKVQVGAVETGARLESHTLAGEPGSGAIKLNGPAARLVGIGDYDVIMAYAYIPESLTNNWQPKVLLMDENNQVKEKEVACDFMY